MINKQINILFLGGAKRVSLAEKFIEEGEKKQIEIKIFSYEINDDVPISFVGTVIPGLKWRDENLYSHLSEVIRENEISIVIPFLDFATLVSARLKEKLTNENVFIAVSDEKLCEIFFNKATADDWCRKNEINVPSNLKNYPLIAKPITGSASKGIIVLESEDHLKNIENVEDYLIQEFISGKEYSVDIYISFKDHSIVSVVPRERLETQGGESIKSKTTNNPKFIEFAKTIATRSKLVGPVTLQFIHDTVADKLYFIEINPRFGGAVVNSIFAGANSPLYLLNDFLGVSNAYEEHWTNNFLMIRRFSEYYKICK